MQNLDLYAKIESLIGFDEEYDKLYNIYLNILSDYKINSILDFGCGHGGFLEKSKDIYKTLGIDLSFEMIKRAKSKKLNAKRVDIQELDERFDAIVAIGDVINYIKPHELKNILSQIERILNDDGLFLFDLNTLFGFEEVTAGSLVIDKDDEFLSIDAEFDYDVLESEITYFKKQKNGCYTKEKETIFQYYYEIQDILKVSNLKLLDTKAISMFGDREDKEIFILQKH